VNWKQELGRQIREARLGMGLSQDQLGKAARVSRQTINKYENGRGAPTVRMFARLASALTRKFRVEGYVIDVRSRKGWKQPPHQLCLPLGQTRTYKGATLKIRPSSVRLQIEASVKRVS